MKRTYVHLKSLDEIDILKSLIEQEKYPGEIVEVKETTSNKLGDHWIAYVSQPDSETIHKLFEEEKYWWWNHWQKIVRDLRTKTSIRCPECGQIIRGRFY